MILTHGANSLPRRGNTLRLPYSLDIAAFDVDTLKDGDVQWTLYYNDSKPEITKENGALSLKFVRRPHYVQFNLGLEQFENVGAKYAIEIDFVSTSFKDFLYYGPSSFSLVVGSGTYFTNTGLFVKNEGLSNVQLTQGRLNYSGGGRSRYEGLSNNWPKTVRWVIDESNNLVEIYFDNVLKLKFNATYLRTMLKEITFNSGALEGIDGIVKVSGLRIYNVK